MRISKIFLPIIAILSSCVILTETAYFIYKKLVKKEIIIYSSSEINWETTGLFMKDKDAGWILKPNASTADLPNWDRLKNVYDKEYHGVGKLISTNSTGYRGKLYSIDKPDNAIRILVLGGSTTWGCFNDDGTTWPEYLEKILQERINRRVEVINGAVGAYTSLQNLIMFRKKYQFYNPDIILIACWYNDMYNRGIYSNLEGDFDVNEALKKYQERKFRFKYPFRGGRVLYAKILNILYRIKQKNENFEDPTKGFFEKYYTNDKIWIKNYLNYISQLKAPQVDIIAMPSFFSPNDKLPDCDIPTYHRFYLAKDKERRFLFAAYKYHTILFQELLMKKGYSVISCYPAFEKIPLIERNEYFADEIHLTAKGNRLLALQIADNLKLER